LRRGWDGADKTYPKWTAVAGVIVGARLGVAEHRAENARVFTFQLDTADWARLDAVHARSRDLFKLIGDCGDEYRR
jgi:diketogulonate reductase-like aldo/keto reductase